MSKLLALDQASRTSGYAIFKDNQLIDYGTFTYTDDLPQRLVKIRDKVLQLIKENKIDRVAFEDIQMQTTVAGNVSTFKALAEVFGVITETLEEYNIPYDVVPSVSWKSTLKIKGRKRAEQKANAKQYVIDTYGVSPTQDACDAICIGAHIITQDIENSGFDWSD